MEKIEKGYPLIIVFYLDKDMMRQADIIKPFAEAVNQMLAYKEANALAFFIPTEGEERVECINPVIIKEADMEAINKIVEDIKKNFMVDIPVEDKEITLDEKPCECGKSPDGTCKCNTETTDDSFITFLEWDYNGPKKFNQSSGYIQNDWNQTLMTKLNQANAMYHKTSAKNSSTVIKCNKHVFEIIETFDYFDSLNMSLGHRKIIVDDTITENVILVSSTEFPEIIITINIQNYE